MADHGADKTKPCLLTLLGQMQDALTQLTQQVEELQWENLSLKCKSGHCKLESNEAEHAENHDSLYRTTGSGAGSNSTDSNVGTGEVSTSGVHVMMEARRISRAEDTALQETGLASQTQLSLSGEAQHPPSQQTGDQLDEQAVTQSQSLTMGRKVSSGRSKQFTMRRPWADHHEFFNVQLAPINRGQTSALVGDVFAHAQRKFAHVEKEFRSSSRARMFIVHPYSRKRGIWVATSMVLLLYDLIVVPLNVCFSMRPSTFTNTMDGISTAFWTLDIPLTFFTGLALITHLELRPSYIAMNYVRSWFLFDVFLVAPEYATLVLSDFPADQISVLRMARWGRLMRLLRLARIARIPKAKHVIRYFALHWHLSRVYVSMSQGWLGLNFLFIISLHLISCIWHGLGDLGDNGWIKANDLESASVGHLYAVSAHWSCSRMWGMASNYNLVSTEELVLDSLLIITSLLAVAVYFGQVTSVVMTREGSKPLNLWRIFNSYSQRHKLSTQLDMRLGKAVEATHYLCAREVVEEEDLFLVALPENFRKDVLFESRVTFLTITHFFIDLVSGNERLARDMCNQAMSSEVIVELEITFDNGDAGNSMRFITSGLLVYERHCGQGLTSQELGRTDTLSEAALWTNWEHVGKLLAMEESTLLDLDVKIFGELVEQHREICMHAVRYAKHFVWRLNHRSDAVDDLCKFDDLDIENLNKELFDGTSEDHFVFISHYKVEAGTEATLIRDLLEPMIREDQNHPSQSLRAPIFIDSEDLIDLARLKSHVQRSSILMLLLTPGVLSRPWCLLEIVTAVKNNVVILPVEVQRPGSKYQYPDEDFYAELLAGRVLSQSAAALLETERIGLDELVHALRQVFQKISLPFSPHKSKTVRDAELHDILNRSSLALEQRDIPGG